MEYKFNAKEEKERIVKWIREFFEKNGPGCNAVLGISGGKDSSVAAALCVEALGKERVIGVLMPNGTQHDIADSLNVVNFLGIQYTTLNIKDAYLGVISNVGKLYRNEKIKQNIAITEQTKINLAPRLRMASLYAVSQSLNGRVVNTCNLSEDWVGYSTRYGDSVGDFSPLSNYTVTEVKQIGIACGLPEYLVYKVPSDGLCGKTDEDNLGFTYDELDKYIRTGEINNLEHKTLIDNKHKWNKFKLELMKSCENDLPILAQNIQNL